MFFEFEFNAWPRFRAVRDMAAQRAWMRRVRDNALEIFKAGINGPHTGKISRRRGGGGLFNRSTPREFPARDSGGLLASLRGQYTTDMATIGTNQRYSKFLREGTRKMARRRMSDTALMRARAMTSARGWVAWKKTKQNR